MQELIALIVIIVVAAVIAGAAFGIYRWLHPKMKETRDEKQDLQESLDRILQPIEDEEVAKQVQEYKDEEDE